MPQSFIFISATYLSLVLQITLVISIVLFFYYKTCSKDVLFATFKSNRENKYYLYLIVIGILITAGLNASPLGVVIYGLDETAWSFPEPVQDYINSNTQSALILLIVGIGAFWFLAAFIIFFSCFALAYALSKELLYRIYFNKRTLLPEIPPAVLPSDPPNAL
jgi:hypothetical protein